MRLPGFNAEASFTGFRQIYQIRDNNSDVTEETGFEPAGLVGAICAHFLGTRFCRILGLDPEY